MGSELIQALGDSAVRFARPPGVAASAMVDYLLSQPGVLDVVLTEAYVAVMFDPLHPPSDLPQLAQDCAALSDDGSPPRQHDMPVRYDGPDLHELAKRLGCDAADIIRLHSSAEYEVAMLGFQPGFAYLRGLDPRLILPRRDNPRTQVPAGSVALGGPYTAIYPYASPGGWHLLGHYTGPALFSPDGALLQAGDRVRMVPVS